MNTGYTQSNVNEKKHEMAEKMLRFDMYGKKVAKGGRGMVPKLNGGDGKYPGGQNVDMNGQGGRKGPGQKAPESNGKGNFIGKRFYSQHGKE